MSGDRRGSAGARRRRGARWLLAPLLAALAPACQSNQSGRAPDAAGDGGADALEAGGDGACNQLAQLGALVRPACDSGTPPVLAGGSIADGTYVLTETHFFRGCSTAPLAETLVVSEGTVQSIATGADGGTQIETVTYMLGSPGAITEMQTCPAKIALTTSYAATPTTLTIVLANALATRLSTFTLQP